jgi:hypothetical protein
MASELKVDKISPATGTTFTIGDSGDTFNIPSGATIANSGTATGFVSAGAVDLNGAVLTLDANANTTITADTDDQIDIAIAGADDFQMTANTFTVLSGSTLNAASGGTLAIAAGGAITNAGTMAPDISSTGKAMVLGF